MPRGAGDLAQREVFGTCLPVQLEEALGVQQALNKLLLMLRTGNYRLELSWKTEICQRDGFDRPHGKSSHLPLSLFWSFNLLAFLT